MDCDLGEELELFKRTVRDFVNREIAPVAQEWDEKGEYPMHLYQRMADLGFIGLLYPEEYGGAGANVLTSAIFIEEINRGSAGIAGVVLISAFIGSPPVYHFGTPEQKRKYLPPTIRGEKIAAFALTEPNAGSNAAGIETTARRQGDHYVLNGSKIFITNGSIADYLMVAAVTDKGKGAKGISLFLVEKDTPGFSARRIRTVGWRCGNTAELTFEDCLVPRENLLGVENQGFYHLMKCLNQGRVFVAASSLGVAQAAFEEALRYAQERSQFGQAIGKFQAIRFKLADMATELDVARHFVYRAAWMTDRGLPCSKECSMAKLFASEMANRVVNEAFQIFGGYGFMMEYPIQRLYRDVRAFKIVEGTSEIQRDIIARQLGL